MAFKMKGPGLPGYKKQVGSGFYRSNRSPILNPATPANPEPHPHAHANPTAMRTRLIEEATAKYNNMSDEEKTNIQWDEVINNIDKVVQDSETTITTTTEQFGTIKGESTYKGYKTDDQAYADWLVDNPGGKRSDYSRERDEYIATFNKPDQTVFRGETLTEVITPKKPIEYTNFKIRHDMIGNKVDNNDYSARHRISGVDGVMMNGELSIKDINALVAKGDFKYEVDKDGEKTGNLLMSKDYHANSYVPMVEMYERGQENINNWRQEQEAWSDKTKLAVRNGEMTREERKAQGIQNGFLTKTGGKHTAFPDQFHGNPNFDPMHPALYNDDEVAFQANGISTAMPTDYLEHRSQGAKYHKDGTIKKPHEDLKTGHRLGSKFINQQGDRNLDWEWNEEEGQYTLKDGAQTIPHDIWVNMSRDGKQQVLNTDKINSDGMTYQPIKGYRDESGVYVSGGGLERKPTKLDHLLTGPTKEQENIVSKEDQESQGGNVEGLAVQTHEGDLAYTPEDSDKINLNN